MSLNTYVYILTFKQYQKHPLFKSIPTSYVYLHDLTTIHILNKDKT